MTRPASAIAAIVLASLLSAVLAGQDAPRVLATSPPSAAESVPHDFGRIEIVFDRPMATERQSIVRLSGIDVPPLADRGRWRNDRCFVLALEKLPPDRRFGLGLNDETHHGFAAKDGSPLPPTRLEFRSLPAGVPPPPFVVRTVPETGADAVDPSLAAIVVEFSLAMRAGSMSLVRLSGLDPLPYREGSPPVFESPTRLSIPVRLAPGRRYAVGVNSATKRAFAAEDGTEALPYELVFATRIAGGDAPVSPVAPEPPKPTPPTPTPLQPPLPLPTPPTPAPPAPPPLPAPATTALCGTWTYRSGGEEIRITLEANGTYGYRYRGPDGSEDAKGRWKEHERTLEVVEDGEKEPLVVPLERLGPTKIALTIEGIRCVFERATGSDAPPALPKPLSGTEGTGSESWLLFTRYESTRIGDGEEAMEIPVPRTWQMRDDGSGAVAIFHPEFAGAIQNPFLAPDGDTFLAASDHLHWDSALLRDLFEVKTRERGVERITGSAKPLEGVTGTGSVVVRMINQTKIQGRLLGKTTWQGGQGRYTSFGDGGFRIDGLPAGTLWIRFTVTKHIGDLVIVTIAPGQVTEATMEITRGNRLVSYPSTTPDRRWIVCLSEHAYYDPKKVHGEYDPYKPLAENLRAKSTGDAGFDTIAAIDRRNPAMPAALWNPIAMEGRLAKDPRLSFDGRTIAFALGTPPMESVAVMSLQSFLAGRPEVRVVVEGEQHLGRGWVGGVQPAWSRDGRTLAYVRVESGAGGFTGDVYVVGVDGSAPRRVTRLEQNQCAASPSFSLDGRRLAFAVVTSRRPVLDVTDIATVNISSDIWTIGVDGGSPKRLTNDGRSAEPCFGL